MKRGIILPNVTFPNVKCHVAFLICVLETLSEMNFILDQRTKIIGKTISTISSSPSSAHSKIIVPIENGSASSAANSRNRER